jgi:hypothetical protein
VVNPGDWFIASIEHPLYQNRAILSGVFLITSCLPITNRFDIFFVEKEEVKFTGAFQVNDFLSAI